MGFAALYPSYGFVFLESIVEHLRLMGFEGPNASYGRKKPKSQNWLYWFLPLALISR